MTVKPDLDDLAEYQAKDNQQALDAALAEIRAYCGWDIAPPATVTSNVWSLDGCSVMVRTLALTSVTSVVQDGVTLGPSTYTFETYGLIRRTPGTYFSKLSRVAVTFVHGYTTLPADVMHVALALAQRSISDTRGMVPRAGAAVGAVTTENYGTQLTDADKAKLAPYVVTAGFA